MAILEEITEAAVDLVEKGRASPTNDADIIAAAECLTAIIVTHQRSERGAPILKMNRGIKNALH